MRGRGDSRDTYIVQHGLYGERESNGFSEGEKSLRNDNSPMNLPVVVVVDVRVLLHIRPLFCSPF